MAIIGTLTGDSSIRTNLVGRSNPDSTQEKGWDEVVSLDKGSLSIDFYYHVCRNTIGYGIDMPLDGKRYTVLLNTGVEKADIIKYADGDFAIQYRKKDEYSYRLVLLSENWFYKHAINRECETYEGHWYSGLIKFLCIGGINITFNGGR